MDARFPELAAWCRAQQRYRQRRQLLAVFVVGCIVILIAAVA